MKRTSMFFDTYLLEWAKETLEGLRPLVSHRARIMRYALLLGLREIDRRIKQRQIGLLLRDLERYEAEAKARPRPQTYRLSAEAKAVSFHLRGTLASPPVCCN